MNKKVVRGLAVGAAAFLLAGALGGLGLWRSLEWKSWDARMRLFTAPARRASDIVLILVDQYSLDFYKKQQVSWPWPRQMYAAILGFLKAGGAKVVFFDLVMTEPSTYFAEDDVMLAKAIGESGHVVLPVALSEGDKETAPEAEAFLKRIASASSGLRTSSKSYLSATADLPIYLDKAGGGANVQVNPDKDGVYRRVPLLYRYKDIRVPSVALALAEAAAGPTAASGVALEPDGRMLIRFFGPTGTYRGFPAATIINSWLQMTENKRPQIEPREFAGKVVLIGVSAFGLQDIKTSPLSGVVPGVEIQAAALDSLWHRHYLRPTPVVFDLFLALLWAVLAGIGITVLRRTSHMIGAAAGLVLLPAASSVAGFAAGTWIRFVLPEAAVLFAVIGAAVLNYAVEGRQRRFLKNAFRYYLSPHVIERVIDDPNQLRLGGVQRDVTSFFSDVAGFTSISEALGPEDLVSLLNVYLSEMTDIILDSGGTLDKYEGDAIVAFWNAPLDIPDHALRACRAALACQKRLAALAPDFEKRIGRPLRARIGLNSGPAVVGNMGSSRRFDYTAMGDTINLAARLESAGKQYGVGILAGEATVAAAGDAVVAREVDRLRVVGKTQPVRIFELIGERGGVPAPVLDRLAAFERLLASYRRRDWDAVLEVCRALEGDPVAAVYAARCERFRIEPPPADWDFVFDLKMK
jgi:adenylate cyclase